MKQHKISLALIALAIASSAIFAGARRPRPHTPSDADIKKAEYIFLEAANARADGRHDDYFMLLRRANALNPSDPYIAGALAEVNLITDPDSAAINLAFEQLKERFEAAPLEAPYSSAYANIANYLGRTDDLIALWSKLDSLTPDRNDPAMYLASAYITKYTKTLDTAAFNAASRIYDRLEAASGPTLPIIAQRVNAYTIRHDTLSTISALQRLAAASPRDSRTAIYIATAYDYLNMPDSALAFLDRAEAVDSTNGDVYLARADFFHSKGDSIAYDREVFNALQAPDLQFEQKFQLFSDYVVKLYTDTAQHERIEQMFRTMQEQNPGEAALHSLYGAYKAETGELEAAEEQFNYSLDLDPAQRDVWVNLIQVETSRADTTAVEETSARALKAFPGDSYFVLLSASSLAMKKDYDSALALLDSAIVGGNKNIASVINSTKADYFYAMGQRDSAFVYYAHAIEDNPQNYMALNNCAYFMALDSVDINRAELYASMATSSNPGNPTFLDTYAWVEYVKGDYPKAKELIDKTLALFDAPEAEAGEEMPLETPSEEIYDHAGDIYFKNGDLDGALAFWQKALDINPDNEQIKTKLKLKALK